MTSPKKRAFGFGVTPPPDEMWKTTPPDKIADLFPTDAFPWSRLPPSMDKSASSPSSPSQPDAPPPALSDNKSNDNSDDDPDDDGDNDGAASEAPPPPGPVGGLAVGTGLEPSQGGTGVVSVKIVTSKQPPMTTADIVVISVFSALAGLLILVLIGLFIHVCVKQRRAKRAPPISRREETGSLTGLVSDKTGLPSMVSVGRKSDLDENVFLDVTKD